VIIYAEFSERSGVYLTDGDSGRIVCQACAVAGGFPRALAGPTATIEHLLEHRSGDGALRGRGEPIDEFTVPRLEEEAARRMGARGFSDFVACAQADEMRVEEAAIYAEIERLASTDEGVVPGGLQDALRKLQAKISYYEAAIGSESTEDNAVRALEAWWRQLGPAAEAGGFTSVNPPERPSA